MFLWNAEKIILVPQPRSVTPPSEKVPSSASTVDMSSSSVWTTWTDSSEDVVMAGNPSSSLPSQAAAPNPWSVNINDMLDSIDVGREELKESKFFNRIVIHSHLFHSSPNSLVDEQGIFFQVHNLSCDVESLALFHGRQATQSIRVNSLSWPLPRSEWTCPQGLCCGILLVKWYRCCNSALSYTCHRS